MKHCSEFLDNLAKPPKPFTKLSWLFLSLVYAPIQLFKDHSYRNNFRDIALRKAKIDSKTFPEYFLIKLAKDFNLMCKNITLNAISLKVTRTKIQNLNQSSNYCKNESLRNTFYVTADFYIQMLRILCGSFESRRSVNGLQFLKRK